MKKFRAARDIPPPLLLVLLLDMYLVINRSSLAVSTEVENLSYDTEKLRTVDLNEAILDMVADKNYVILSSGIKMLWERFSERFALKNVIADTLISADTKYFVVKLLQEKGYTVTAYGDGRNDYYMLKQADNG